jgi:uncharacterized protein YutD
MGMPTITSTKDNKYVVNQKLEHVEDISSRYCRYTVIYLVILGQDGLFGIIK